jgi:hypothetical protein
MQVKCPRHHYLTLYTHIYRMSVYGRPAKDKVERAAEFVFGFSSQTANYKQEDDIIVPLRHTTREGRAPSIYTPSAYDNCGHSRGRTRCRRGG